ncbi:MAG: 2-dehydropantoate 2-reductase [Desulfurococcales archaeon]|nr:2-dehydropantoate 2-reductase [Desulfurococcales archaeon]
MLFCIIGAGAVGSVLAYVAELRGCSVRLYSRSEGLRYVKAPAGTLTLNAEGPPWRPTQCDYMLLAVKAYDTRRALEMARTFRVASPILLVVQNGLGGLEEAESMGFNVAGGVADFGAFRRGALVELRGTGRLIVGCRGRDCSSELAGLRSCLDSPLFRVEIVDDIEPYRWLKLAVNAAVNSIATLLEAPNGVVAHNPNARRAALIIAEEVERIAHEKGIRLPAKASLETIRVAESTSENINSLLQDIELGRRTEVDYILGPLAASSRLIELVYHLLKSLEEERRGL